MKLKHWRITTNENEFPRIGVTGRPDDIIVFSNSSHLGQRACYRWAEILVEWLNKHMDMGRLDLEKEAMKTLRKENAELKNKLYALERAARRPVHIVLHADGTWLPDA
jgi:hypothetical protein